jgi:hypothetical protein
MKTLTKVLATLAVGLAATRHRTLASPGVAAAD